jgi:gas vesicle protein
MKDVMTTIHAAKDGTLHAVTGARGGLLDTVKTVAEVVAFLRSLGADKFLRQVGLMRPKASLVSLGVFATGLALGAGLGMLFAPMSGRQTRSYMRKQLRKVEGELKTQTLAAAGQAEERLEEALETAEEAAEERLDDRANKGKKARRSAASADKATL